MYKLMCILKYNNPKNINTYIHAKNVALKSLRLIDEVMEFCPSELLKSNKK